MTDHDHSSPLPEDELSRRLRELADRRTEPTLPPDQVRSRGLRLRHRRYALTAAVPATALAVVGLLLVQNFGTGQLVDHGPAVRPSSTRPTPPGVPNRAPSVQAPRPSRSSVTPSPGSTSTTKGPAPTVPVCGADKYFTQLTVEHFDARRENNLLKVYVKVQNSDPAASCRLTGEPRVRVDIVDSRMETPVRDVVLGPGQTVYIRLTSSDPRTTPSGKCAGKVQGYDVTINNVRHAQQYDYQVCIDLVAEAYLDTID